MQGSIDLAAETPLPLSQAAKHRLLRNAGRGGKPINVCTLWRWTRTGVAGVRLESVKVGASLCTTEHAIVRFLEKLSDPDGADSPRTPSEVQAAASKADRQLVAAGF